MPRFINEIDLGPDRCQGSMNSEGLPNSGIEEYNGHKCTDFVLEACDYKKPYFVSLSGLKLKDNIEMIKQVLKNDKVSSIELNLACPNIPGKPTIAYDFEQMEDVFNAVVQIEGIRSKPLGVKLAPYFDFNHLQMAAKMINKHVGTIRYVTTINTIGNGLFIDTDHEMACIAPKGGYGGIAGGYCKNTALANVKKLSEFLDPSIDIVGVGGVRSGADAFDLILCGAAAVQVGTQHWTEGPQCFDRIAEELEALMKSKGYSSINDFKGKLRNFEKGVIPMKKAAKPVSKPVQEGGGWEPNYWMGLSMFLILVVAFLLNKQVIKEIKESIGQ
jgi:dihydroorotate dehydrogenase (fumarate)